MSDLWLSLGHFISVVVIAAGLAMALWHVWALASKLGKDREVPAVASSASKSQAHADDSRARI